MGRYKELERVYMSWQEVAVLKSPFDLRRIFDGMDNFYNSFTTLKRVLM